MSAEPSGEAPDPPVGWRELATRALQTLPLADLTVVDRDGYPLCLPVTAGELNGEEVPLRIGPGAPECPPGPGCLTVHGHDEQFSGQENHTFVGTPADDGREIRFRIERALADWSIVGNRAQAAIGFLAKGRRLGPRLKAEAARRGQPVPQVRIS